MTAINVWRHGVSRAVLQRGGPFAETARAIAAREDGRSAPGCLYAYSVGLERRAYSRRPAYAHLPPTWDVPRMVPSLGPRGPPSPRRRAACPAPIVFQLGLVARPCPRHGPQSLLWAFDRPPKPASGRLKGSSPFDGSLRPDESPAETLHQRRRSTSGRRSVGDRSLRQQRRGDTIEAIAPDAATLRSRHVARRMDCGSSWTLPRITAVAVVDVGRAQLAARCAGGPPRVKLPTGAPLHCAMLRRNSALRFSCA